MCSLSRSKSPESSTDIKSSVQVDLKKVYFNPILQEQLDIYDKRINSLQDEEHRLRTERNAILPVSRLPVEILTRIFKTLAYSKELGPRLSNADKPWDWLSVTKVCRHWRNVALEYPNLWTDLKNFADSEKIRAFFDRSRNVVDLTVVYVAWDDEDPGATFNVLRMLNDHFGRIKEFTFTCSGHYGEWEVVQELLEKPTHRLKKLDLRHNWDPSGLSEPSYHLEVSHISMQNLRPDQLSLEGLSMPWTHSILSGLSELSLSRIVDIDYCPTTPEIFNILEACPNLQNLVLDNIGLRLPSVNDDQKRSIDLRSLSSITLTDIDANVCVDFFSNVIVPKNVEWTISCKNYPFENPILPNFIPKLLDRRAQCKRIILDLQDKFLLFRPCPERNGNTKFCLSPSTSLKLLWDHRQHNNLEQGINSMFVNMKNILGHASWKDATSAYFSLDLKRLEVTLSFTKSTWCHWLDSLPKLENLNIHFPEEHHAGLEKGFAAALSELVDVDDPFSFRCRELKELTLTDAKFSTKRGREALREIIEQLRYRTRQGKRLCKLAFLNCSGVDKQKIDELKKLDIIDEVENVEWTFGFDLESDCE